MKKYIYILFIALCTFSCTEEIVLDDIANATPRLVVEANLDWNKYDDIASKRQTIKLTMSTSYYSQTYPIVTDAVVTVTNSSNESMGTFVYNATEELYVATDFVKPVVGETYTLRIEVNGQVYTAEDEYTSIETPNHITQSFNSDFGPDNEVIEVKLNVSNEIGVDNFFLFKIEPPKAIQVLPDYSNADDSLLSEEPGKDSYDFNYIDDEIIPGDILRITTYGISQRYNNFLTKVLLTIEGGSDGPFSTAPATIRGNILNETNQENRAFGYFSINQFTYTEYTVLEKDDEQEEQVTPYEAKERTTDETIAQ
ncbi:DUF4249 family protein [Wenyingzhuangia sp. IMCC45574]